MSYVGRLYEINIVEALHFFWPSYMNDNIRIWPHDH